MTVIPPYLKKGDTIGVVCPAGFMPYEKAETCLQVLQEWGYEVKIGKTLGNQNNYFSGSDEERLNDLQAMLDDDDVHAILFGRGGYGMSRIIDQLDFTSFVLKPKWIVGFSDITLFHSHVLNNYKIAALHAPMAAAFNNREHENEFVQSLRHALSGKKSHYKAEGHPFNRPGAAAGKLIGGNLALLAHATGTPSEIDYSGKILFIEDIGEYIYAVDRMMYQLKRSGKFDQLAGMIFGGFTDIKDTAVPFGQTIDEVLKAHINCFDFPVCFNFPVSHNRENYALKIGVEYELKVSMRKVGLREK